MNQNDHDDNTRSFFVPTAGGMISHYRIIEKIGAGGMGEVFLADDTKLNRQVALKFLPPQLATDPEAKTRFTREAQSAAALNHPNIVHIYEVAQHQGRPYLVMEYITGKSLHAFAHDAPKPIDEIIDIATQLCAGLAEAHSKGIVHRDIKTSNIVMDDHGRPKLVDFGLATFGTDQKITKTGSTVGTVAYMSPEQVQGKRVDHRSDLFSLGIVLYELLAGQTPFKRESEAATLQAILAEEPQPVARYRSDVPDQLQHIISKLLAKDADLRYQNADGVLPDLRMLKSGSSIGVVSTMIAPPKKTSKLSLAIIGVVALLAVVIAIWQPWQKEQLSGSGVPMIAVLPFENLGSADDEYFADGMTEEITSRLAVVPGLGVISRTSAIKYKATDKSMKAIGRELGVEFILEGTVRWSKVGGQTKVRITPQLIRVADDRHMWANNYERDLMDIFAVQADIAAQIVEQMGLTLVEEDRQAMASRPTENASAYEHYLKGISGVRLRVFGEDQSAMRSAAAALDTAVMLDPDFAEAHAIRSMAYSAFSFAGAPRAHGATARLAAERALELKPNLPTGHMAMGVYYNLVEMEYDDALEEFNRAKSELHNDADLLSGIALVQMRQGRFLEAQENYRKATELDPINAERHWELSDCLAFTRSYDEANEAINRAIVLEPSRTLFHNSKMGLSLSQYGDTLKLARLARVAIGLTDTLDAMRFNWELARYFPELPLDSLVNEFREQYRDKMGPGEFYAGLLRAYLELGDTAAMLLYADSGRMLLEMAIEFNPKNGHLPSFLGATLALLGECEQAVEYGLKGREILSVEECHW